MSGSSLAIIIPAYNEHDRLGTTLSAIETAWREQRMSDIELTQVIVTDDGSTDDTLAIAASWKGRLPILSIRLERNTGKGAAVRAGVGKAIADFVLLYDADSAAPITEANKLFQALKSAHASIAIGSRVLGSDDALVTMAWHRRLIGRVYHTLCSGLVPGIRDTACGCKLFKYEVAMRLFALQHIDRFAFDVELLAIALRLGERIIEVPVRWTAVPESKVRLGRDGLQMFWCLLTMYGRKMRGKL